MNEEKDRTRPPEKTGKSKAPQPGPDRAGQKERSEKEKALEGALKIIEKTHGKGAIQKMGAVPTEAVPVIPSGSLALDMALGVGGYPRGRIVEIYGPEMSGKTTVALLSIAEAQKAGGTAVFIDAEHALDAAYAESLGVDVDNLLVSQPDNGEQALDIMETLVRSGAVDIIVVDSVPALVPRAELEGTMDDVSVGTQARLMSKAMRKLSGAFSKSNTVAVFINQIRYKIGGSPYANPEVTPGGLALKFYASVRVEVRRAGQIRKGDEVIGHTMRMKVQKNKVAPPFRTATVDLIYGKGIDRMGELVDMGVARGIIARAGSWYNYGDLQLGQGRDNAKSFLLEHPDLVRKIRAEIIKAVHP